MAEGRPKLLIIAGPNGSGKSTVAGQVRLEQSFSSIRMIDPDKLAFAIRDTESLSLPEANREALDRIELWLDVSIACLQDVGVETVLSTDKYRSRVLRAKALGFEVSLIYVLLESVDLNVRRVKARAAKGLHDVPEGQNSRSARPVPRSTPLVRRTV